MHSFTRYCEAQSWREHAAFWVGTWWRFPLFLSLSLFPNVWTYIRQRDHQLIVSFLHFPTSTFFFNFFFFPQPHLITFSFTFTFTSTSFHVRAVGMNDAIVGIIVPLWLDNRNALLPMSNHRRHHDSSISATPRALNYPRANEDIPRGISHSPPPSTMVPDLGMY